MQHIVTAGTEKAPSSIELKGRTLARKAAAEGFVLLKNDGVLPLKEKKVALFGAGARMTVAGGTGSGAMHERYSVSIEEGLENAGFQIVSKNWIEQYDQYYKKTYQEWHEKIEELVKDVSLPMEALKIKLANQFIYPTGIPVTREDMENADSSVAIYVVSRQAGEGNDREAVEADYYLDELEKANLKAISEYYKKTLVVINCGGVIDTAFMEEFQINGLIFYAQGGEEGGNAFADIVSGKVNPSGKLTDTWAKKYEDYPSAGIFSKETDPLEQDYEEGIYVGYRYFDSFDIRPRYHFGYGLSYTEFEIETKRFSVEGNRAAVEVEVKNTGKSVGKEVVQIYGTIPYGDKGNEFQRLLAFVKTPEIAPGEVWNDVVVFELRDLAEYSEQDSVYFLNAGEYKIRVGNASDHTKLAAVLILDHKIITEKCCRICPVKKEIREIEPPARACLKWNKCEKIGEEGTHLEEEGFARIRLKASDIAAIEYTYPDIPVYPDESVKEKIESMNVRQLATLTVGGTISGERLVTVVGASGTTTSSLYETCGIPNVILSDGPAGLNLSQRVVQTKDGEVKGMDLREQYNFGAFRTYMLSRLGKETEGTVHYQYATALPCSLLLAQTWNTELLEEIGENVGAEMEAFGVTIWLAPGMNIHRNPLCGRNFEYYSEDPYLSGCMAAALTNGVQSHPGKGVSLKHFCANNAEVKRDYSSSNLNERTLREIYLKGFEIALRKCRPRTVMASYNKINGVYNTNNFDLLVRVLRNEWGFEGLVMSDWEAVSNKAGKARSEKAAYAQCDLIMPGELEQIDEICQGVEKGEIRLEDLKRSAGRVLKLVRENTIVKSE